MNVRTTQPKKRGNTNAQATKDFDKTPVPASINPGTNVILDNHSTSNVFCCTTLGDATTGTFYTNMTGSLSVTSLENMQASFVAYDYDTNKIFAKPCPDFKDDTIIAVFEEAS